MDVLSHHAEIILLEAAGGESWGPKTQPAGAQGADITCSRTRESPRAPGALRGALRAPGASWEQRGTGEARHEGWDLVEFVGHLPGHVFLLQAMEQSSSTRSARPPSVPLLRRSRRMRWLSEPPAKKRGWGWGEGCS